MGLAGTAMRSGRDQERGGIVLENQAGIRIDLNPEALDFWARTLETDPVKIRHAVQKVGPMLDRVKLEPGIGGAG